MMERQIELEERMVATGLARAERAAESAEKTGRGHQTVYARLIIKKVVEPLAEAITQHIKTTPRRGRSAKYTKLLGILDPGTTALICISTVLKYLKHTNKAGHDGTMTKWGMTIGRIVEDEIKFNAFKKQNYELVNELLSDFKKKGTTNYRYMHRVMTKKANDMDLTWVEWTPTERAQMGVLLLKLLNESCGVIEFERAWKNKKSQWFVKPTEAFVQWAQQAVQTAGLLCPMTLPCVIPPDDWIANDSGGYWTPQIRSRVKFVKVRTKEHQEQVKRSDLTQAMSACNALQRTPWRVNKRVKDVLAEVWQKSLGCGLPSTEPAPIPPCPFPRDKDKATFTEDELEIFNKWKREASKCYRYDKERMSKCFQLSSTMSLANEFQHEERIYFPFQTDSRGRMYAVPSGMSPQGPNFGKGILEFADGKPLGATGEYWFLVHGANMFGKDKLSYEKRAEFIKQNADDWCRVPEDPIGTRDLWGNADKPWQFLAWCYEFRDFCNQGSSFKSHIPIALDGSCNGLQHFSAVLRDPIGGAATNLVDADVPADIYQMVADVCIKKLMLSPNPLAQLWLEFGIDRKICKKPVMTMPYGSTRQACTQSVYDFIMEKDQNFFHKPFKASVFLTEIIWASIGEVVVAAREAMAWLRKCASIVSSAGLPMIWTAPSGFKVFQHYTNKETKVIQTLLLGNKVELLIANHGVGINSYRMRNGASPNFVHSCDASHLVKTVNAAYQEGMRDFACIHDDFGTHACDTEQFQRVIREQFVNMYTEHSPLHELKAEIERETGCELPEVPEYGTLDIKEVLKSKYFFG